MIKPEELVLLPDGEPIDEKIGEILTDESKKIIDATLLKYFDQKVIASFGQLEKIELYLTLASKDAIFIPPQLRKIIREVNQILPGEKINTQYLSKLDTKKRNRIIYIITTAAVLVTLCFTAVKGIDAAQFARNLNRIEEQAELAEIPPEEDLETETEAEADTELQLKEQQARDEFERRYSQDLETAVADLGWEAFIVEYSTQGYEKLWAPEKVFDLLITQEPRYWCRYMVKYPDSFIESIQKKGITLSEFMSSCGPRKFLTRLAVERTEPPDGYWIWSDEEVVKTLKSLEPDWAQYVKDYPNLFAGHLTQADLAAVVQQSTDSGTRLSWLLDSYNPEWDKSWSRRELLYEIQRQDQENWVVEATNHADVFADCFDESEIIRILNDISTSNPSVAQFSSFQIEFFDNYYALKLYRKVDPAEFSLQIQDLFAQAVAEEIFTRNPVLKDLEHRSIAELFETGAISYVLENYADWNQVFTVSEIMEFLRTDNKSFYYAQITPYPEIFSDVTFTDAEIAMLAFSRDAVLQTPNGFFFDNYDRPGGWSELFTIDQVFASRRNAKEESLQDDLDATMLQHPELLPYLNQNELYRFIDTNAELLQKMRILEDGEAVWEPITNPQNRRILLDHAKQQADFDWKFFAASNRYFFAAVMSFEELQEVMSIHYLSELRQSPAWVSNSTPEWEYQFFKSLPKETFTKAMAENIDEFQTFLTEDDAVLILIKQKDIVFNHYRLWKNILPPELILNTWLLEEPDSFETYGSKVSHRRDVIANESMFYHLFYSQYDFAELIKNGGFAADFESDYANSKWAEIASVSELYAILYSFDEGKAKILENPDLFFDEVVLLDPFMEAFGRHALGGSAFELINANSEWYKRWPPKVVYESAKKYKIEGLAYQIFSDSENTTIYSPFVLEEDLDLLISTFQSNGAEHNFGISKNAMLSIWSSEQILSSLKENQPQRWGGFVSYAATEFKDAFDVADLELLIKTGATPTGLVELGYWTTDQILIAYQEYLPDTWGQIIIMRPDKFAENVKARGIPFRVIMEAGGDTAIRQNYGGWVDIVWPKAEMDQVLAEMGIVLEESNE